KLEPIPVKPLDELYSKDLGGEEIRLVRCRRESGAQRGADGRPAYPLGPPGLEGGQYKGRRVVTHSRFDTGCALENHRSPNCLGHDHDSAVKLARAAVLYALKR